MAFTYTEAQAVSDLGFDDMIHDQVYDETPFWKKLQLNEQVESSGGGREWTWPVKVKQYGKANAVDPDDRVNYIAKKTRTMAYVDPKHYVGSTMISWKERQQNKGKAKIIDLVKNKSEECKEDFIDRLNTDLWTANPNGVGLEPISSIVDSSTSTASGGITPTDCDTGAWVSPEDSETTKLELYGGVYGTTTYQSISSMTNAARYGGNGPTMYLTTKDLRSVFESILEAHQIFEKLGDKQMADAGFKNVSFHGVGVFDDPYVPAGSFYGLDMKALAIFKDPDDYLEVTKWEKHSTEYPKAMVKAMFAVMNLKWERRRTSFKLTNLDASLV
jgi:hypothetical protein